MFPNAAATLASTPRASGSLVLLAASFCGAAALITPQRFIMSWSRTKTCTYLVPLVRQRCSLPVGVCGARGIPAGAGARSSSGEEEHGLLDPATMSYTTMAQQYELLKQKKAKLTEKLCRFFKVLEQRMEKQPLPPPQMAEGKRKCGGGELTSPCTQGRGDEGRAGRPRAYVLPSFPSASMMPLYCCSDTFALPLSLPLSLSPPLSLSLSLSLSPPGPVVSAAERIRQGCQLLCQFKLDAPQFLIRMQIILRSAIPPGLQPTLTKAMAEYKDTVVKIYKIKQHAQALQGHARIAAAAGSSHPLGAGAGGEAAQSTREQPAARGERGTTTAPVPSGQPTADFEAGTRRVREGYTAGLACKIMAERQAATALYFIDRLGVSPAGCCHLRYEHVRRSGAVIGGEVHGATGEHTITFDFLEEGGACYRNAVSVSRQVWKNVRLFKKAPKVPGDLFFDRLDAALLDKYLAGLEDGLTVETFRMRPRILQPGAPTLALTAPAPAPAAGAPSGGLGGGPGAHADGPPPSSRKRARAGSSSEITEPAAQGAGWKRARGGMLALSEGAWMRIAMRNSLADDGQQHGANADADASASTQAGHTTRSGPNSEDKRRHGRTNTATPDAARLLCLVFGADSDSSGGEDEVQVVATLSFDERMAERERRARASGNFIDFSQQPGHKHNPLVLEDVS